MTNPSSEHLQLFDNLFEPILILRPDGEIIYFNHYLVTFAKLPPRILREASHWNDVLSCQNYNLQDLLNQAKSDNKIALTPETSIKWASKDKSNKIGAQAIAVMKAIPITVNNEMMIVLCFNDLSVEKTLYDKYRQQYEELKETHSQIIQADKLSTLGELTASISHEISNPLTIASGNVEVIELTLQQQKEEVSTIVSSALNNVKESLTRLEDIIKNMKDFLYQAEDKKEYYHLEEVVDHSIELVKPFFEEANIKLVKEVEGNNHITMINKVRIEQVIVNLLKNALDALVENKVANGNVVIKLAKDSLKRHDIITVSDNGPGINQDLHDKIFSPFFTTKEMGNGTGLGLSISSKIVEAHQGKLQLSKAQKGETTFTLTLPSLELSSYSVNESLSQSRGKNGKKILVVDNEVQILNVLNTFFQDEDLIFIGSNSGEEALRFLDEIDIDVIITDYQMPEMNGSQLAQAIREKNKDVPILYMTSSKNLEYFQKDKDVYQISGLIVKPFTKEEVINTIKMTLKD
ncbi:MAG: hybrid sensor histidine kinase/response regulator [bacterium]